MQCKKAKGHVRPTAKECTRIFCVLTVLLPQPVKHILILCRAVLPEPPPQHARHDILQSVQGQALQPCWCCNC